MNSSPLVFAEGLRHRGLNLSTWIRQFARAIIFLLSDKSRAICHYRSRSSSKETIFAVIATATQLDRLSSISGKKYTDILTTETSVLDDEFELQSIIKLKRRYLLKDLFISFFTSSNKGSRLTDHDENVFLGTSYDFLNDQNFFSRICLNIIDVEKTSVFQHGIIRLPRFYFPVNCCNFHGYELVSDADLDGSRHVAIKYAPSISLLDKYPETKSVFVATHSVFRDVQLIVVGAIWSKNIICKPHPTAKFKCIYSFLHKLFDFELTNEIDVGFQKASEFWTFYSSLAIDARCNGLAVRAFRGMDRKPWYICLCEEYNNSVDEFRVAIGARLFL